MTEQSSATRSRAPGTVAALAAATALAVAPFTAAHEGLRNKAYLDPVGIPTICYGHTAGVRLGMTATDEQCHAWLRADLAQKARVVLSCTPNLADHVGARKAATDFAFNTGEGAYCRSTLAKKFAAGDIEGGCAGFAAWVYAGGQKLAGLVGRRGDEQAMCLAA